MTVAYRKTDWLPGLALGLIALSLHFSDSTMVAALEGMAYDLAVARTERFPSDQIAVIAIDDASVANIGRWPWSRDVHARAIDTLAEARPKVIAEIALFSEPERGSDGALLEDIARDHQSVRDIARTLTDPAANALDQVLDRMGARIAQAREARDTDGKLAESLARAGNVVLPMVFRMDSTRPVGRPDRELAPYAARSTLKPQGGIPRGPGDVPLRAVDVLSMPIEPLGRAAVGLGHLQASPDRDGVIRSDALLVDYYGYLIPSLALTVATQALRLRPQDVQVAYGEGLRLGSVTVQTGAHFQMRSHFYGAPDGARPFAIDSFFDLYSGKIAPAKYRDKIVLIGPTAAGIASPLATPIGAATAPVMILAHTVSSLLEQHYVRVPSWGALATLSAIVLVTGYLVFGLPGLAASWGALVSAVLLAVLVLAPYLAITRSGTSLQLLLPAILLVVGHLLLTTRRYLSVEAGRRRADAESAESNRMLGLALQGQGQLDAAFEKYRRCPPNEALKDNLYGLALDFERKRQFNKAEAVLRHLAEQDPAFRDVRERIVRARQLSDTVMLGAGSRHPGGSLLTGAGVEQPMLGRYRIERELGRGAMGSVYVGTDPRIGRRVAIKTLALVQEFEGDALKEARERFFREAETAGRLNHPNIVTIFDAGEEEDLAYIAMEYVDGVSLQAHAYPGQLLAIAKVVSIVAEVAEALDYAHRSNVVHRDIKPANIIYEALSGSVKVTDFGIARITDASRTKTGIVLGTPSFMSPEQLAGERVDGRSDLYSLGVSLFVLLCARLPFEGETMAALMYRITNDPAPDIRGFNPVVGEPLAQVLHTVLAKDPARRFQTGAAFARALREASGAGAGAESMDAGLERAKVSRDKLGTMR